MYVPTLYVMLCYGTGNLPSSGQYEVDISSLEPGPHLFIITFDDGYGKSLMKICPFSIGTGMCSSIEIITLKQGYNKELEFAS